MLAFGRRQPLDEQVINLNPIIRENAEIMERLLGNMGQLVLEFEPNLGQVRPAPAQFQQVLLNLTINARDAFRDSGRVTIPKANREIKMGNNRRLTDTPPGRYVVLTVSDNGTDIDEETQQHMFEPFFTTKPEGQGTGLGLVYGVVQQSGGLITVHSELGAGSTFEIMRPEHRGPVDISAPTLSSRLPSLPVTRGHETVLLVEKNDVLRKMAAGMLAADDYRVLDAKTNGDANAKTRGQSKPLELLMVNLSEDRVKLARSLYMTQPGLRVLNICNQNALQNLAWLLPEHQYSLPKPFALSELLRAARKLLDV